MKNKMPYERQDGMNGKTDFEERTKVISEWIDLPKGTEKYLLCFLAYTLTASPFFAVCLLAAFFPVFQFSQLF